MGKNVGFETLGNRSNKVTSFENLFRPVVCSKLVTFMLLDVAEDIASSVKFRFQEGFKEALFSFIPEFIN